MGHRVLFCTLGYAPEPAGGAERQAQLQADALTRRGHDVTVVCATLIGMKSGRVGDVQVDRLRTFDVRRLPYVRHLVYALSLIVYLLLSVRRYDVVHVHLANYQADIAVVIAKLFGRPVYVKIAAGGFRGDIDRMSGIARLTRRRGLRGAARVQAISREIAEEVRALGIPEQRIVAIPNGIELEPFQSMVAAPDARAQLDLPPEQLLVLFQGRFAAYKGVPDLLVAWPILDAPDASLLFVGELATDEPLARVPQGDRVIVHGWTDRPRHYLAAADVFVLPSLAEGMSNALLEAMASGLAVVATRVGAADQMIEDGVDGLLVDAGDAVGLAGALGRLLDDAALRQRLGDAAAQTVRERYGISVVVDQIEEQYEHLINDA
ncbi:MAG TPA: glycosyltransferase family 4 protein [Dehalococcoidia bacterium]|nr:glycosyltransferase family 4 protein [Dehalococcoidia bacterium]